MRRTGDLVDSAGYIYWIMCMCIR